MKEWPHSGEEISRQLHVENRISHAAYPTHQTRTGTCCAWFRLLVRFLSKGPSDKVCCHVSTRVWGKREPIDVQLDTHIRWKAVVLDYVAAHGAGAIGAGCLLADIMSELRIPLDRATD